MSDLHALLPIADVLEGEIKSATLPDGTVVAIYNVNGTYYVTDDTCTHEEASLSDEGMIDGTQVICGWHLCGFEIATGATTASPCDEPLKTYPVTLVNDVVHVAL